MSDNKYDYVVIGSGAGGATLAKELSAKGKSVAVLEKGVKEEKLGSFLDCCRYFDLTGMKMAKKSKEGVIFWRSIMAGGSTSVSCGNGVRCLEKELAELVAEPVGQALRHLIGYQLISSRDDVYVVKISLLSKWLQKEGVV